MVVVLQKFPHLLYIFSIHLYIYIFIYLYIYIFIYILYIYIVSIVSKSAALDVVVVCRRGEATSDPLREAPTSSSQALTAFQNAHDIVDVINKNLNPWLTRTNAPWTSWNIVCQVKSLVLGWRFKAISNLTSNRGLQWVIIGFLSLRLKRPVKHSEVLQKSPKCRAMTLLKIHCSRKSKG